MNEQWPGTTAVLSLLQSGVKSALRYIKKKARYNIFKFRQSLTYNGLPYDFFDFIMVLK